MEVVAGEEVVETSRPHEEAGLHPIGGGCSRRREVHELDETAPARILVSAPAARGAGGFLTLVKCSSAAELKSATACSKGSALTVSAHIVSAVRMRAC